MKQNLLILLVLLFSYCGWGQVSIYARFINYSNQVLKTDGSQAAGTLVTANTIDPTSNEFFKVTTFTQGALQTLNIGSQSTGAGAGKIKFDSLTFSRPVDAASPRFLEQLASGTAFRTVEFFFTEGSGRIVAKQLYKLVALKTVRWVAASCTNDCPLVIENVSLQYGGQIETIYKSGATYLTSPIVNGWNAVRNIQDNDPNAVIN